MQIKFNYENLTTIAAMARYQSDPMLAFKDENSSNVAVVKMQPLATFATRFTKMIVDEIGRDELDSIEIESVEYYSTTERLEIELSVTEADCESYIKTLSGQRVSIY